ncbi:MAG: RtcB family protein [Oscillospiraceae bacterium]|nr:RtcB family protein [Oscillospiraceae bacterium]
MLELRGKYAEAKVFTDVVDRDSISQVMNLLNQPYAAGSRIRLMPDIHAGMGCTIGTTMTIGNQICPNLVGVDIGCGMETVRVRETHMELQKLDKLIRLEIPSGFAIRDKAHRYAQEIDLEALHCGKRVDLLRAEKSIGTLGGGNHFIEVDKDDAGQLYIVIHSGSRHLGVEIATYYQNAAFKAMKPSKEEFIPKNLAYVEGELLEQYLHDMKIAQEFAMLNRHAMMDVILKGMGLHVEERFTTVHNYIDTDTMILRKGAVSARKGEKLLIPINMRDGSLICVGKGNEEWNFSAPHGAGRLMSRGDAKASFTVSQYKKEMEGIYTTSVGRGTLDECPMAYKRMEDIVDNIDPTVEITDMIRPVYNFKAGEGG